MAFTETVENISFYLSEIVSIINENKIIIQNNNYNYL